jgi:hypothetical protein
MTTRAGLVGLGTGIVVSGVLFYPLYIVWPSLYIEGWLGSSRLLGILLAVLAVALLALCGRLTAAWSGASRPGQRIASGALAGGLAAFVLFCSLGAAAAGTAGLGFCLGLMREGAAEGQIAVETSLRVIGWTQAAFWCLTLGGMSLGMVGASLHLHLRVRAAQVQVCRPAPPRDAAHRNAGLQKWPFRRTLRWLQTESTRAVGSPMMALNTSITAAPSAAVAVILVGGLFGWLPDLASETGAALTRSAQAALDWPLATAMLLYLAAQLALTLVVPHEARQARHRCAIDEVKMAAYVGIGVPLALVGILGVVDWALLFRPLVLGSLLASLAMAVRLVIVLFSLVFPIRAQMPLPRDQWEAIFFGTIAHSRWQSLVLLCLGCGVMMAAPTYVAVAAATINITAIPIVANWLGWNAFTPVELVHRLYGIQALAGLGSSLAAALALTGLYLFYLGLGKGFHWIKAHD